MLRRTLRGGLVLRCQFSGSVRVWKRLYTARALRLRSPSGIGIKYRISKNSHRNFCSKNQNKDNADLIKGKNRSKNSHKKKSNRNKSDPKQSQASKNDSVSNKTSNPEIKDSGKAAAGGQSDPNKINPDKHNENPDADNNQTDKEKIEKHDPPKTKDDPAPESNAANAQEDKKEDPNEKDKDDKANDEKKKADETDEKSHNTDDKREDLAGAFKQRFGPGSERSFTTYAGAAIGVGFLIYLLNKLSGSSNKTTFSYFINELLAKDRVIRVEVEVEPDKSRGTVNVYLKPDPSSPAERRYYFDIGDIETFEKQFDEALEQLDETSTTFPPLTYKAKSHMGQEFLIIALSIGIFFGVMLYLRRSMPNIGDVAKSGAKLFKKNLYPSVTFKDVAGLVEAKQEISEFVSFLKHPKKYLDLGARIPRGALLVGPPGTGKTLLAKATAGEASVPFYSISGSEFTEMFVGVGASRVRDLFKKAKADAPSIVFIDEIDAVGRKRGSGIQGGNDERENTLNQLLVEMDGFDSDQSVIVLAGTNREDVLDKALLRPGRFDRTIALDNPDIQARQEIFGVHMKGLQLAVEIKDISFRLAELTPGFSGADIANVCNEAALIAARNGKLKIDLEDFESAIDRVIGGLEKKNKVLSPEERTTVAHHEAGHAVAGWFLQYCDPLLKVSIVPRGTAALGFAQYLPKDQYLRTKEELFDRICMALGGRVAESLIFNKISTGAQDDLDKVTKMAYGQIVKYGMNEKVGLVSFPDGQSRKPYSDKTAELIDSEARQLVGNAYNKVKDLLTLHLDGVKTVASMLLQKEVLKQEDMIKILGERPTWGISQQEMRGKGSGVPKST